MFAFIKAGNLKTNIADDEAEGQLHVMFSGQFFSLFKTIYSRSSVNGEMS